MTLAPEDLELRWADLALTPAPDRQFRSRRLDPAQSLNVHAALRTVDDAPCILVDLPKGAAPQEDFEVGGMRLSRTVSPDGVLQVLSLEEASRRDMFAKLCADVINAADGGTPAASLGLFLSRLDAWRQFLKDVRPAFSRTDVIGLMGELHVLQLLLQQDPTLAGAWRSPDDGLQDFEWQGHAVEVKTSVGPSPQVRISLLDQLDDAGLGRLDLVHVRYFEDPAGDSLADQIAAVESLLAPGAPVRDFRNGLLRRGLPPGDAPITVSLRCTLDSLTAWQVRDGFPRLIRSAVPAAITDVDYALDPRQLAPWLTDVSEAITALSGAIRHG